MGAQVVAGGVPLAAVELPGADPGSVPPPGAAWGSPLPLPPRLCLDGHLDPLPPPLLPAALLGTLRSREDRMAHPILCKVLLTLFLPPRAVSPLHPSEENFLPHHLRRVPPHAPAALRDVNVPRPHLGPARIQGAGSLLGGWRFRSTAAGRPPSLQEAPLSPILLGPPCCWGERPSPTLPQTMAFRELVRGPGPPVRAWGRWLVVQRQRHGG